MNSGNNDYHYTHWTIYPDRFTADDLEALSPHRKTAANSKPPPEMFYCTAEENDYLQ
jgi:hypothetical protein